MFVKQSAISLAVIMCYGLLLSTQVMAMGRLFISAEQRMQLDQGKQQGSEDVVVESEAPSQVHLNGFIKPSAGPHTIWVNGVERQQTAGKTYLIQHWINPRHSISVELQGERAELMPGQKLDVESRKVAEIYEHQATENTDVLDEFLDDVSRDDTTESVGQQSSPVKASLQNVTQVREMMDEM